MASNDDVVVKEGIGLLGKEGKMKFNADDVGTMFDAVIVVRNGNSVHEEAIRVVKPEAGGEAESFDKGEAEIGGWNSGNELRVQEMGVEFSEENVENVGVGGTGEEDVERGSVNYCPFYRLVGLDGNVKVMVEVNVEKLGRCRKSNAHFVNGRCYEEMAGEGDVSSEVRYGVVGEEHNVLIMEEENSTKRARSSPTDNGIEVSGTVAPREVDVDKIHDIDVETEVQERLERARCASDDYVYGGVNVEKLEAMERRIEGVAKAEGIELLQAKMERPRKGDTICCDGYSFSFQDEKKDGFDFYDFVWCKLSGHTLSGNSYWWPGLILDPSNASKIALDLKRDGHLLVAYFGDETFVWSDEFHLRHFQTYFLQMEKQRCKNSLQDAVDAALEYVSRHVELAMTCGCCSSKAKAHSSMLNQKMINAGTEKGICTSAGNRTSIVDSFDPKQFIGFMYSLAVLSNEGATKLDLAILNAHVSVLRCSMAKNGTGSSLLRKRTHVTEDGGKKLSKLKKNNRLEAGKCNNHGGVASSHSLRPNRKVADFTSTDLGETKNEWIDSLDDTKANTQFNVGEIMLKSDDETTKKCSAKKKYNTEDNDEKHPEVISGRRSRRKCTEMKSESSGTGMMPTGYVQDSYWSDIIFIDADGELISEGQQKRRKKGQEVVAVLQQN